MLNQATKELVSELAKAIISHDPGSFGLYLIIQAKEKRDLKWAICNFIEKQPDDEMKNILEALGKELEKPIRDCVAERRLDVVSDVKAYLVEKLEEAEIDKNVIVPIVDCF